jgi:hemolysin III
MTFSRPASGIARFIKDPFSGLSHALGAVLAVAALVLMLVFTEGGAMRYVALSIYGTSLILLFSASAMAHSIHCSEEVGERLDRLDYAAIFLLIAGTYTPLCLTVLRGPWGWTLFGIEWGLALMGATLVLASKSVRRWTLLLYIPMGWLLITAMGPLIRLLPIDALIFLIVGGIIYSLGAIVFLTGRPKLFPGKFGSHDLWHVMVLLASGCHLVMTFRTAV